MLMTACSDQNEIAIEQQQCKTELQAIKADCILLTTEVGSILSDAHTDLDMVSAAAFTLNSGQLGRAVTERRLQAGRAAQQTLQACQQCCILICLLMPTEAFLNQLVQHVDGIVTCDVGVQCGYQPQHSFCSRGRVSES